MKKTKNIIKKILIIFICFIFVGVIRNLFLDKKIDSLSISSDTLDFNINNEYNLDYKVDPTDAKIENIEFVSSNKEIITLGELDKDTFTIKTHKEGMSTIYLKYNDGKSNQLMVSVIDNEKNLAEKKVEEAKVEVEKKPETKKQSDKSKVEAEAHKQVSDEAQFDGNTHDSTEQMVYMTRTGSKYHNKPNCGRAKYASSVTLKAAQNMGLSPCKKCY